MEEIHVTSPINSSFIMHAGTFTAWMEAFARKGFIIIIIDILHADISEKNVTDEFIIGKPLTCLI